MTSIGPFQPEPFLASVVHQDSAYLALLQAKTISRYGGLGMHGISVSSEKGLKTLVEDSFSWH